MFGFNSYTDLVIKNTNISVNYLLNKFIIIKIKVMSYFIIIFDNQFVGRINIFYFCLNTIQRKWIN